ncbi:MAG: SDR family oxidoreductase [Rhodospirillales bacterium]|nr:SDR family oxidoreductase [Rhodospirillales bacterium]
MGRLGNKAVLVTGAGGGIGGAIAERFAAEGARVLCCDLDESAAARVAAKIGGDATAHGCDVSDPIAVQAAVARAVEVFGALHVLVNAAAGREPIGDVVDLSLEDWRRTIDVNLTGIFLMCKYGVPEIAAAGGGSIVNIASQLGSVVVPNRPAYVTTKAAVIQLSRSMAVDFADRNVRVNSLSPGATETDRLLVRFKTMEAARAVLAPLHPIGRLGRPDEIADAALFLASDESSFMTGSDMVVDGGYNAV